MYTVERFITHSKEFAGNQGKHLNWDPSILPHNLWLIFMGIKPKKIMWWNGWDSILMFILVSTKFLAMRNIALYSVDIFQMREEIQLRVGIPIFAFKWC